MRWTSRLYGFGLFVVGFALATSALARGAGELAVMNVSGGMVEWHPLQLDFHHATLRVATPQGDVVEHSVAPGGALGFALSNSQGQPWPDGQYVYELTLAPHPRTQLAAPAGSEDADGASALSPRRVQTGGFRIVDGAFAFLGGQPGASEETPKGGPRAITASDLELAGENLIVQGNVCAGWGCSTGGAETFQEDAVLELNDSTVRIAFDVNRPPDWPPAPEGDWLLVANDDGSGSRDRFSIAEYCGEGEPACPVTDIFTILGGAPESSLVVNSLGRVGFGTATPARDLHVVNGSLPTLRLEQDGSEGLAARTWDLFGGAQTFQLRDVTGGQSPLVVESSSGNVGLGTPSPAVELHIKDSNAPTLRLEQDTTGGQSAQTWDVGSSFGGFVVKDVTNNRIPVWISPNAPTFSLFVANSGKVGIGTLDPQGQLHLNGGAAADVFAGMGPNLNTGPGFNYGYAGGSFGRSAGFFNVRPDGAAAPPNPSLRFMTQNVQRMIVDNEGYIGLGTNVAAFNPAFPIHHTSGAHLTVGGTWNSASSRELKENIHELAQAEAVAALLALQPVKFNYKAERGEDYVGFIAEDVPELVASNDRRSLSPTDIVAVLTRVLQQQQQAVEEQQQVIAELRARLEAVEQR